jgi:YolD-like protein
VAYHPKTDRAKLFAPFDALRGLREALREKERIIVPKIDLSEEMKDELDRRLNEVSLHDIITIVYYDQSEYVKLTGMVAKISPTSQIIQIVDKKILFRDIVAIQVPEIHNLHRLN